MPPSTRVTGGSGYVEVDPDDQARVASVFAYVEISRITETPLLRTTTGFGYTEIRPIPFVRVSGGFAYIEFVTDPASLEYFTFGPHGGSMKKIVARFDGYEEGSISGDTMLANLYGTLLVTEGARPLTWTGVFEVASDNRWGSEYYKLQDLYQMWLSVRTYDFLNAQLNRDIYGVGLNVPIKVLWMPPYSFYPITPNRDVFEVPFTFMQILE
jgi:hypothetical protein